MTPGFGRRRRWTSVVLALVLLPSFAPDTFGRACPHHRGDHGGHGGPAAAHGTDHGADHGATHGTEGARHGGSKTRGGHAPTDSPAPHPPCTCAGSCTVSSSPGLPPAPAGRLAGAGPTASPPLPGLPREVHLPGPPDHVLPLSTAPPGVR